MFGPKASPEDNSNISFPKPPCLVLSLFRRPLHEIKSNFNLVTENLMAFMMYGTAWRVSHYCLIIFSGLGFVSRFQMKIWLRRMIIARLPFRIALISSDSFGPSQVWRKDNFNKFLQPIKMFQILVLIGWWWRISKLKFMSGFMTEMFLCLTRRNNSTAGEKTFPN